METVINKENCYWEIILECSNDDFELLSYYLFEYGAEGVEELKTEHTKTRLKVFFTDLKALPETVINSITSKYKFSSETIEIISTEKKPVENWQTNWKTFFKPLFIGDDFVIRPPWEDAVIGKKEIVIEPGMGFGTGYHESTRLAVRNLDLLGDLTQYQSVIDIGTGSGVLAIATLLQNTNHVTAIDIDESSLNEVPYNLELSGFEKSKCLVQQSEPHQLETPAKMVIANITADVILKLQDDIERLTLPNGLILLSGIFHEFYKEVKASFLQRNELVNELKEGEWHSIVFKKR